jgi:RNA polymerase sigma factor (TIGR02999 family)
VVADPIDTLLDDLRDGAADAASRLYALLYDEFHRKAHFLLRTGARQTLCTTELVNETWLRLQGKPMQAATRVHFFNIASMAMRQVLIDRARARQTAKRGEGLLPLTLSAISETADDQPFDVLAVDQVMNALERVDPKLLEIAQLHLFGGLRFKEIAELLGASERTVFRQWRSARMYLVMLIQEGVGPGAELAPK